MDKRLRVLHVEDSEQDEALLTRHLSRAGYAPVSERVETLMAMRAALETQEWDVILCDYSMPRFSAPQALALLQEIELDIPFIVISGTVGEATAVEVMRAGAHDYLMKDNLLRLAPTIERELHEAENRRARRRAEESLRESEERYRVVAETATDVILTIDENSTILFVNGAVERVFGYTVPELLRKQITILMPEYLRHVHQAAVRRYVETGRKHINWEAVELPGLHKSGREIPLELSFGEFSKGERRFFTGIARDISERKRNQETLLQSEERYRLLFERNPQPMFVFDLETLYFLEVNDAAIHHYGYSREEFLAMTIKDIRPPEDIPALLASFTGNSQHKAGIWKHKKKDGTVIDVEMTTDELTFYERSAQIVLVYDVTKRRALEEQLRQSQKLEAVGTLAGGIAHDFNNILAAIIGYSELAQRAAGKDSRAQAHLEQVLIASTRARNLVRQILTFSRHEEPEREAFQLQPIIDETLKLLRVSLPSTVEIRQNIDTTAPAVLGDATQIQQVTMNLCVNACHAMKERGGVLEVRMSCLDIDAHLASAHPELKEGPHIRLTVSDSGCGMDRATQERIFEPFFTTKAPGEGTGLGLAVVHGVIKNHGGAITVNSEPGVGTTFSVYLPVYDGLADAVVHNSFSVPRGNGEHVLFVDDEEALVSLRKSTLEHLGYRVTAMTDSVEALAAFRSQPGDFDLVITDQIMPHLNGADLATAMLEIRPGLPVILATGYSSAMSSEQAKALGIRELLFKPSTMQALGEAIRRALGEGRKE